MMLYIPPFACGIIATITTELALIIVAAIVKTCKERSKK